MLLGWVGGERLGDSVEVDAELDAELEVEVEVEVGAGRESFVLVDRTAPMMVMFDIIGP